MKQLYSKQHIRFLRDCFNKKGYQINLFVVIGVILCIYKLWLNKDSKIILVDVITSIHRQYNIQNYLTINRCLLDR